MLNRRKVFLHKVETTKGTDAVPDVANDLVVLNGDANVDNPTEQDTGEGELKGTMGPGESVTIKQSRVIPVSTRVRGLGQGVSALLTPHIHAGLMASAHTVTTTGDGSATPRAAEYKPTSVEASIKSATGYFYEDGMLYKSLGAVNDFKLEASMSALIANYSVQATYIDPTVVAFPSFGIPSEEVYRMTSALCSISEGGSTVNIGALTFDAGVAVEEDNETGNHDFEVSNRNPIISIDPKAVATVDDWNELKNATSMIIIATFTNSLGETLVLNAPKAVPMSMSRGARAGKITNAKTFSLKETSGDDQYTLKWTSVL